MPETGTLQAAKNGGRRATIVDVAEHLNLSKGTVSRALNDYPDIAERTRIRVRKAAEQLGYRPLSQAQAIRTGRVRAIGLVIDMYEHDGHGPFLADFLAGLTASAAREGWTLTVATAETEADTIRLLSDLHEMRKVDGFILPRTYENDGRVQALKAASIPHVLFGRITEPSDTAFFDIAGEAAMAEAVARLHALGHRRIGFVKGGAGYTYSRLRLQGYQIGLEGAGLPLDEALIAGPAVTTPDGAAAARALLALDAPPTAILFAVDRAALGAYPVARKLGLSIGQDLSLMSYDGIPEGALMAPPLSSFRVDLRQAGMRLADLLIRQIRDTDPGPLQELARAEFSAGGSHGEPRLTSDALAAHVSKKQSLREE